MCYIFKLTGLESRRHIYFGIKKRDAEKYHCVSMGNYTEGYSILAVLWRNIFIVPSVVDNGSVIIDHNTGYSGAQLSTSLFL
jgi:hypothetical protein